MKTSYQVVWRHPQDPAWHELTLAKTYSLAQAQALIEATRASDNADFYQYRIVEARTEREETKRALRVCYTESVRAAARRLESFPIKYRWAIASRVSWNGRDNSMP